MSITDNVLNFSFRMAKAVSVVLAGLLAVIFVVALSWSLKQLVSGGSLEAPDFTTVFNEDSTSVDGSDSANGARSAADAKIDARNRVQSKYGVELGEAMKSANCSDSFESTMQKLTDVYAQPDGNKYFDDIADGAIDWFEDAAKFNADGEKTNPQWLCGNGYWVALRQSSRNHEAEEVARKATMLQGFAVALSTLLAAFALMVVPAIYRIEESLRNRAE